jgi:hypothetical protein
MMSENPQPENSSQPETASQFTDRREARHNRLEERRAARAARPGGAWMGGAILIAVGVLLMLQNLGATVFKNWWALFILIPAVGALGNAWRAYQEAGYLNGQARGSLIGGIVLAMVTAVFLFELNWGILGPVILILAGAGLLINAMLPAK